MKSQPQIQAETLIHLAEKTLSASLSELRVLDKRIERHFNAGTLSPKGFCALDALIMEEMARLESLTSNH
jgi:hypothetical protein